MRLKNKTPLITDANSGIGSATARLFVTKGAKAAITRRDQATPDAAAKELHSGLARVAQFARASVEPDAELFLDESLSRIPSVDLKEIQLLSRFLPVIALIPRSTAKDQVAPRKIIVAKRSSESSDATKLLGVFGKAMERFKSTSAESMFAFGDVTVSFSEMEALRNGEPVVLTTMEFKTLKYLIQNARRVISRDEMLNEVWGYENYPCTRTVDNHILRLRQKLELDPSRPVHFRTVHGAGYKFLP